MNWSKVVKHFSHKLVNPLKVSSLTTKPDISAEQGFVGCPPSLIFSLQKLINRFERCRRRRGRGHRRHRGRGHRRHRRRRRGRGRHRVTDHEFSSRPGSEVGAAQVSIPSISSPGSDS